jgi:hypothetical protein
MLHEGLSEDVVLLGDENKPNGGDEDDGCVVLHGGKPSYLQLGRRGGIFSNFMLLLLLQGMFFNLELDFVS